MSLKDQIVVVVGGSSGIGFSVAQRALADGARVTIASSNAANIEKALKQLPGAKGTTIDVADESSVARGFEGIGRLDHLVYTAGDWPNRKRNSITEVDLDDARNNLPAIRFWGATTAVKHAAKQMSPNGSITLTNGLFAHRPPKGGAVGTAMSGALEFLVRGLAVDLAPKRVNIVCPGFVRTGIWDGIPADQREAKFLEFTGRQPLPRIGEVQEIVEAYLFAMRCSYMTGQVLHIDGGASIV